jgi:glycosyltransferase involved in cell wall biosynthesis
MKVSIAMVTYRHEPFIAQAIDSALSQRTDFEFEMVIGEDCSPDRTREIAQEYAARYPEKVRLHLPEQNVGLTRNLAATIGACRGEYVAWLEGDDYWTSPEKLQRQADYLDQNPDCGWCFTRAEVVDIEGKPVEVGPAVREVKPKYTLEDYLLRKFQPRACTVMFRNHLFDRFPDWYFSLPTGDMPLHVLNTQGGRMIGFIDEFMSAYRIHPGGVWSQGVTPGAWASGNEEQQRRQAGRFAAMVQLYETFQGVLGPEYQPLLRQQISLFASQWTRMNRQLGDREALKRSADAAMKAQPGLLHKLRPGVLLPWLMSRG